MKVLWTPAERFQGLEGYDFAPHSTEVGDEDVAPTRIHHVDEGPRDASPIL
jgi:haloalkane dehalogenase